MKSTFLNLIAVLCVVFLFSTCKNDHDHLDQAVRQEIKIPVNMDDGTFVSLQQATKVAKAFSGKQSTLRSSNTQERIVSTETIKGKDNNPSMYVINYAGGGWVIVGSSRNYYPILAYSNENSFVLDENMGSMMIWLDETKEAIRTSGALLDSVKLAMRSDWNRFEEDGFQMPESSNLRSSNPALDAYTARMNYVCQTYPSQGYNTFPPLSGAASYIGPNYNSLLQKATSCGANPNYSIVMVKKEYITYPVGPLLATQWEQESPFNYYCNGYPAGCVTISLAQIMKFHKYPTNYNWDNMPNIKSKYIAPYTNYSTPSFIYELGNNLGLNYTTGNVSANDNQIKQALTKYGYSYTLKNSNVDDVINEVATNKRPVSMGGFTSQGEGHQWVCDGTETYQYITKYFVELQIGNSYSVTYSWCGSASNPLFYVTQTGTHLHMNWGFGGRNDGWFTYDAVNTIYQSGRTNFYIKPK